MGHVGIFDKFLYKICLNVWYIECGYRCVRDVETQRSERRLVADRGTYKKLRNMLPHAGRFHEHKIKTMDKSLARSCRLGRGSNVRPR